MLVLYAGGRRFESDPGTFAPVAQQAVAADLKSAWYRFESDPGYRRIP